MAAALLCAGLACRSQEAGAPVLADVVSVEVTGAPGAYRFEVGIHSPDQGCAQYADWWEVLDESGNLVYRRGLSHSHVDEQPFVRGGEPVVVDVETAVWVRAHMAPSGYGGTAFRGSASSGFSAAALGADFAAEVADLPPGPPECRW